ncbi:hypothetical protein [Corynebacterium sp. TAE3-ERU16]|uniref:hypothetical protein n=1 Tax=Corynebacterium sp. TAE3-ERU16 TaxID=2849493 RepID=UPI001C488FFF|nr:hypothetical protein [Corynebacterium sp. TAE3-ERU16]MBV7292562.1 hypothetical protein [Corynebacterium sp. TAE3-ERU16]
MQQFLALLGALGAVLTLVAQLLTGSPAAGIGSTGSPVPGVSAVIVTDDLGGVRVNGITIGQSLVQVRALNDDFPETGISVYLETGDARIRYDFGGAEYYVDDGSVITRIGMPHTPEGIRGGSSLAEATAAYGRPVHGYGSSSGGRYAVYLAEEQLNLVWIFGYSGRTVQSIYLDDSLERMRGDAGGAPAAMVPQQGSS